MLSVVFIVRDEEERLPAALASLGPMPDVVVCDTGSTDATIDVAERAGARVAETPWTGNFAAARTIAQGHARYSWIFRMDADERLVGARGRPWEWLAWVVARAERSEADVVYVRRRYSPTNEHWFPRLFRADRFRWTKPVHEVLVPTGERRRALAVPGAVLLHRPSERHRGYADLAGQHLAAAPGDPHLAYYRARALWEEGRLAESIPALHAYLSGPIDYRPHVADAHRMLAAALATQGREGDALDHLEEAANRHGDHASAALDRVRLHLLRGERREARAWIARGAEASPPRERAPWGGFTQPYLLDGAAWSGRTWRAAWRKAA